MEGNVLIYRSSTGKVNVSVLFNQDTFWLSQQRMAELFGVTNADISYHLIQLDKSGEVHLSDCIKKILIPSEQWDEQGVTLYNLDVVIAVGYRVNSYEATQFRIWSAKVLKEYIIKGFALDDERLKGKTIFGEDYFEELLDRIREIRTSERRYYQKNTKAKKHIFLPWCYFLLYATAQDTPSAAPTAANIADARFHKNFIILDLFSCVIFFFFNPLIF